MTQFKNQNLNYLEKGWYMKGVALIALLLFLSSCSQHKYSVKGNPCRDSTFIALQHRDLNTLTMSEYDYLKRLENECTDYTARENEDPPAPEWTTWAAIGTLAFIVFGYVLLHSK